MLALDAMPASDEDAARAIASHPGEFAAALFVEAAASDDVTSAAAAVEYLDDRLASFASIIPGEVRTQLRAEFDRLLLSWM